MSYCTFEQLLTRFPERDLIEVTDDDNRGVIDEERVNRSITDTDARIDSYLRTQYHLPLAEVPTELERSAAILIIYDLRARTESITDQLQQQYDQTISYLKDVAAGRVALDVEDPAPPTRSVPWATNTRSRRWTPDRFKRMWG